MKLRRYLPLLCAVAGALLLLMPALYNGYPLVNSDDGTYLNSGFKVETPGDRPITYGLFLRVFSIDGYSMWMAVFFQALVLSWLLMKTIQRTTGGEHWLRDSLITFIVLTLTSLSWTVSQIIPDVWTGTALLAFALILAGKESKRITIFLYVIYFCAVATHMSHLMIFTLLILLVFFTKRFFFAAEQKKWLNKNLLILLLTTWGTFITMSSAYSKSKHVFMMASMVEKGILKKYLDEHCADKKYPICAYKDNLTTDPNAFIWDSNNSPLYKEGGWEATKEEYNDIINATLTDPKYIGMHITESLKGSWRQLFTCHLAEGNFPFPEGTHVDYYIKECAPRDTTMYRNAWQHTLIIKEHVNAMNNIYYGLVVAGIAILILVFLFASKKLNRTTKLFIFLLVAGFLVNVWDCATFAQVNARYGSRIIWVLPFAALIALLSQRKNPKNSEQKIP